MISAKYGGSFFTNQADSPSTITAPDEETETIARHLTEFLRGEVREGRLTNSLAPLQSGIGSVSNAVFHGFLESEFTDLKVYSEVLQDAVFELMDAGKVSFASCCSITLSAAKMDQVFPDLEKYRDRLILRPQEISNHPEVIRRMGLIAINTALEFDIYGNVNSTHVMGTQMMNGIGGSGDFARNARIAIFVTKSIAKEGNISCIVPFVSHVDHTEHDVDVVVTEQGYADLRGLAPRERAQLIIERCAHPMYREPLLEYYNEALTRGGQTPHVLEKKRCLGIRITRSTEQCFRRFCKEDKENRQDDLFLTVLFLVLVHTFFSHVRLSRRALWRCTAGCQTPFVYTGRTAFVSAARSIYCG